MKHARALVSIEYSIAATQWQKATQYTATQTNQPTNQATQLIVLHCGAMENVYVALCLCVEFVFYINAQFHIVSLPFAIC